MNGLWLDYFLGTVSVLYDIIMVVINHYLTSSIYSPKSKPSGKLWTLGHKDLSIHAYLLAKVLNISSGRVVLMWGTRNVWKLSLLPTQLL